MIIGHAVLVGAIIGAVVGAAVFIFMVICLIRCLKSVSVEEQERIKSLTVSIHPFVPPYSLDVESDFLTFSIENVEVEEVKMTTADADSIFTYPNLSLHPL
jgi:hypothetical protein